MGILKKIKEKIKKHNQLKHGFYKTFDIDFDYSKPLHPEGFDILIKGTNILKKLNIPYTMTFGTLLGMYRDGHLIPHDSDLDLGVHGPIDEKAVIDAFLAKRFKLGCEIRVAGVLQTLVFTTPNETIFDLHIWEELKDGYYCFHDNIGYWKFPKDIFNKFVTKDFNGVELGIPEKAEEVVKILYGSTWNIPKSAKEPWIEENYGIFYNIGDEEKLLKEAKKLRREWKKYRKGI